MLFNKEKLANSFSKTFRQILFFVVPATALLIILRAQIVRIVYGAGNFDWNDTILTMNTLAFFSISLFAQATIPLLVRVFYARHNSKITLLSWLNHGSGQCGFYPYFFLEEWELLA